MEWIPRSQNELALYQQDFDDWMVDHNLFNFVNMTWGPHIVDCFAASHNSQIAWFHSRFLFLEKEAVDTFIVNWVDEVCWLVPPICITYCMGSSATRRLWHGSVA